MSNCACAFRVFGGVKEQIRARRHTCSERAVPVGIWKLESGLPIPCPARMYAKEIPELATEAQLIEPCHELTSTPCRADDARATDLLMPTNVTMMLRIARSANRGERERRDIAAQLMQGARHHPSL